MDLVNAVLFHLLHHQTHVAAHHLFALGRQVFQAVNDKTSHRIIVLRRQFQIQDVIEVIQLHGTFHQILAVSQIHQLLFLILVILIAYIAHDFFQDILQGNQTCRGAVLIQNNDDIVGRLLNLHHQLG